MKILHTSDWHVGRTLRGRSRAAEHEAVLAEVASLAAEEEADIVLVAGDLFDSAAPTPEAERIVYRGLLDLAATGAHVIVIAGNHDNERRLRAVAPLFALGRVTVVPFVARPAEGGVVVVDAGEERAEVALVPFLAQRYIVKAADLLAHGADMHALSYADRAQRVVQALTSAFTPGSVQLVCAHLMVAGGVLGGGERSAHTIFDYAVGTHAFPPTVHYVALGHLHRAQQVAVGCPAWYSGSPLQLDFSEERDDKYVLVVDAHPGTPASVQRREVSAGRRLRTLRGSLGDLEAIAGSTGDDWLRVMVREPARAGLADDVRDLFPEAVDVVVDSPTVAGDASGAPSAAERRAGSSPHELFTEFLAERGVDDTRLVALFDTLLEEVTSAT